MSNKDDFYKDRLAKVDSFEFNGRIAEIFDDMIGRSVPLYDVVQKTSARFAARFYRPGTVIYDLGASTGTTIHLIDVLLNSSEVNFVAIDNSSAMLGKCRTKLESYGLKGQVEYRCEDIAEQEFQPTSVVLLNYTLQFIDPEKRQSILERIYDALIPGGIIFFSDKIRQNNPLVAELNTELHHDFKRMNQYSDLEISQKREALENVLIPLTIQENIALFQRAGFKSCEICFVLYNFLSMIAVKDGKGGAAVVEYVK